MKRHIDMNRHQLDEVSGPVFKGILNIGFAIFSNKVFVDFFFNPIFVGCVMNILIILETHMHLCAWFVSG